MISVAAHNVNLKDWGVPTKSNRISVALYIRLLLDTKVKFRYRHMVIYANDLFLNNLNFREC